MRKSRFYFPALAGIYESWWEWAEVLLRAAAGLMLLPNGLPKLGVYSGGSIAGTGRFLDGLGYVPGVFWACVIIFLETIGGVLLAIGLFTRLFAFLLAIEFINVAYVDVVRGGYGRMELALLWLIVFLYFMIRGGGPISVDARLKKEF